MSKTIADKLLYLYEAKEEIKEAIIDKGVGVLPTDGLKSYATKIGEIEGGGSSPTFPEWSQGAYESLYNSIIADWPDIKAIVETEDDEVNKYKCLFLLTNDTPEYEYIENYSGIVKIITSDGEEYNNEPFTHVWDESQDINGKYRYIVFYSNSQNFSFLKDYRPIGIAYNDLATENRTNFGYMFYECYSLQAIPELNTGLGTNFSYMFNSCYSLQTIPELNTELGTNFSYMFQYCFSLQTIPELNTGLGADFNSMFRSCSSLQAIPELNTGLGTDFNSMFRGCRSLQTIYLLSPSFKGAVSFYSSKYLTYDTLIGIFESLPTVVGKTITITSNSNSKLSEEDKEIATDKGWTISVSG